MTVAATCHGGPKEGATLRRFLHRVTLVALVAVLGTPVAAADAEGQVNFFLGQKSLDSEDWQPAEDQPEFGVMMSFGRSNGPVDVAIDILTSAKEADVVVNNSQFVSKFTGTTLEIASGVRKIWKTGRARPYLGGGLALISASGVLKNAGVTLIDVSDGTIGLWTSCGVFWRLGKRFNLGFDLRYSSADVDLDLGLDSMGQTVRAGGFHVGITAGFGW